MDNFSLSLSFSIELCNPPQKTIFGLHLAPNIISKDDLFYRRCHWNVPKKSREYHFISHTAQLLCLTRVKIECFLIRSTDFYEMFTFASPAQFSPLLFYWMVSWWPKWLHGTFLPLVEGNWQVCNYLFNEADLLGPVENIIRDISTFWPSQRIIKINREWRTYHLFILQ